MGLLVFIMAWVLMGWLALLFDYLVTGGRVNVGDLLMTTFFGPICTVAILICLARDMHLLDKTVLKARGDKS